MQLHVWTNCSMHHKRFIVHSLFLPPVVWICKLYICPHVIGQLDFLAKQLLPTTAFRKCLPIQQLFAS
jgi:hypothetical protein